MKPIIWQLQALNMGNRKCHTIFLCLLKTIALLTCLLCCTVTYSQNITYKQNKNNEISDLSAKFTFGNAAIYDNDLKTTTKAIQGEFIISISIDETGKGKLATFITEKLLFTIDKCKKINNSFSFSLINGLGKVVTANLMVKTNDKIGTSFVLDNDENNTAIVFYQ